MSYPKVTKLPDDVKRQRAILAIKEFVRIHRRTPNYREMGQRGTNLPSFQYLKKLFGSGREALLAAGCELRPLGWAIKRHNPKPKGSVWGPQKVPVVKRTPKPYIVGPDFKRLRHRMQAEYTLWERELSEKGKHIVIERGEEKKAA